MVAKVTYTIMTIKKITIIGTGNVAYSLGKLFVTHGYHIAQVFGRNIEDATKLAQLLKSQPVNDLQQLQQNTDLYLICVTDDAISQITTHFPTTALPVLHTAGSVAMDILQNASPNIGVFYPLQSLKKSVDTLPEIPFLITANNKLLEDALLHLAKNMHCQAQATTCQSRKAMHLSAVFASNFTNYMYYCAEQISQENQVSFNLLQPLILETAQRLKHHLPSQMQTGPAVRGDVTTQKKHIEMLESKDILKDIYTSVSTHIFESLGKKDLGFNIPSNLGQ
jgi:predicted short-subunit dehydrogenase-like oxidoreductase (DUF2520 family)